MARVNTRRVWLGAAAGWAAWCVWSAAVNALILAPRYGAEVKAGALLAQPRYPFFLPVWFATLFALALLGAWLYAGARATRGAGPATAFKIGAGLGFASGFPLAFSLAAWAPFSRVITLGWMLQLWVGAIVATLIAGRLYRD